MKQAPSRGREYKEAWAEHQVKKGHWGFTGKGTLKISTLEGTQIWINKVPFPAGEKDISQQTSPKLENEKHFMCMVLIHIASVCEDHRQVGAFFNKALHLHFWDSHWAYSSWPSGIGCQACPLPFTSCSRAPLLLRSSCLRDEHFTCGVITCYFQEQILTTFSSYDWNL